VNRQPSAPVRERRVRRVVVLLLALGLAVAGCSAGPAAAPAGAVLVLPHGEVLPVPALTAAKALGDLATLDPCALADTGRMGAAFTARPDALDSCALIRQTAAGPVRVFVGPLVHTPAAPTGAEVRPGLRATAPKLSAAGCTQLLEFGDHVALGVTTDVTGGLNPAGACALTTTAVRVAADQAAAGLAGLDHHVEIRPGTYAAVDPCALLDPGDLAAAHLAPRDAPGTFPQHHRCDWLLTGADPAPEITATVDTIPLAGLPASPPRPIAGRPSYVVPLPTPAPGGRSGCVVQTAQVLPDGYTEVVVVVAQVLDPAGPADLCPAATGAAAALWPHLPEPTR
jgi:hypothetical protein